MPTPTAEGVIYGISALPVYRLIASPAVADVPSRLVILYVRLAGLHDTAMQFSRQDLKVTLPDGSQARIFDQPRAVELVRRTTLGEADLGYVSTVGDHPPGGIHAYVQPQIADWVLANLLSDGVFGAGQVLQGYLVVDTGVAYPRLDGGTVEVTAYRLSDAAPERYAYQFPSAPPAVPAP